MPPTHYAQAPTSITAGPLPLSQSPSPSPPPPRYHFQHGAYRAKFSITACAGAHGAQERPGIMQQLCSNSHVCGGLQTCWSWHAQPHPSTAVQWHVVSWMWVRIVSRACSPPPPAPAPKSAASPAPPSPTPSPAPVIDRHICMHAWHSVMMMPDDRLEFRFSVAREVVLSDVCSLPAT